MNMTPKNLTSLICLLTAMPLLTGCSLLKAVTGADATPNEADTKRPLKPGDAGYVDPGPQSGPLGKKYAGKVVFSSKPIAYDDTDDSAVMSTYDLDGPLFIRFWSKESPHNLMPQCAAPRLIARYSLNGSHEQSVTARIPSFGNYMPADPNSRVALPLSGEAENGFTTRSTYDGKREDGDAAAVRRFNASVIPRLTEGKNTLRIVVDMDCGTSSDDNPLIAEGKLEIVVQPAAKAAYLEKYGTQIIESPHPENAELVPKILELMAAEPKWDNETFLGARVLSKEWSPIRHRVTGLVVAKEVTAALIVRQKKEENSELCRTFRMTFRKDPAGGGLYFYGLISGSMTPIACANAPE